MVISRDRINTVRLLLVAGPLVTVAITPWTSYDAINIPKLAVLVICASMALALLVLGFKDFFEAKYRSVVVLAALFSLDLLLVLFNNFSPFEGHFFGTFGRNTGFLAYISLVILFVASALSFGTKSAKSLVWAFVGTGAVSAIYGILQSVGWDPFKWVNQYSPVIGFLGNPDFQSSLLGMCGVAVVALLLRPESRSNVRALLGMFLVLLLYVILKTKAQQGFLVLAAGSAVVLGIFILRNERLRWLRFPYVMGGAISLALLIVGTLDKGPLGHLLYKPSVTYRGDYWYAGWKMTLQHPLLGVGLDSYGNWYRASRSVAATLRRGPDAVSNAAHNVLLDFSSNGGFPLLIFYLLIVGLVFMSAIRFIKRSKGFDAIHAALFGAWVAYQAQSIISLNQIGIAVWGWIFSGALIAYEIESQRSVQASSELKAKRRINKGRIEKVDSSSPATSLAIFLGLMLGLAIALPPFLADAKYRTALSSGSAPELQKAVTQWPIDDSRVILAAQLMANNKLDALALDLAKLDAHRDPRSFDAWRGISMNPKATPAEKSAALSQMKILDPHNLNLK